MEISIISSFVSPCGIVSRHSSSGTLPVAGNKWISCSFNGLDFNTQQSKQKLNNGMILSWEASTENWLQIFLVFICFGVVTGLWVNLSKSGPIVVGNAAFLADLLCSKMGFFPGINLGMP
ncbi:hypothetical protein CMV_001733 [Castanea mollissima]|uniref:Uncharacterized protein n=1 Tax=Castanea mollissima TaxID=60419 RepID=A0A8J4RKD1_9ROSI|nr:hypothetical protein CMV_001733 [Castanea mollissima]